MNDAALVRIKQLYKEAKAELRELEQRNSIIAKTGARAQVDAYARVLEILEPPKRALVLRQTSTGYFADYRRPYYRTRVHAVNASTKKPICGARVGKTMEYLWTNSAVECEHCWHILANQVLK